MDDASLSGDSQVSDVQLNNGKRGLGALKRQDGFNEKIVKHVSTFFSWRMQTHDQTSIIEMSEPNGNLLVTGVKV